eukprot:6491409-Amphidinium_carterae.1
MKVPLLAVDVQWHHTHDLLQRRSQNQILEWLRQGRVEAVHMSPPTGTWLPSRMRCLRDADRPWRSEVKGEDLLRVQAANALARFVKRVVHACWKFKVPCVVQHPRRSWLWRVLNHPTDGSLAGVSVERSSMAPTSDGGTVRMRSDRGIVGIKSDRRAVATSFDRGMVGSKSDKLIVAVSSDRGTVGSKSDRGIVET